MYKVTWVIDYGGKDIFRATIKDGSAFKEDFHVKQISSYNLNELIAEIDGITKATIDGFDHYGKIWPETEVSIEITEGALNYIQCYIDSFHVSHKLNGCFATILLLALLFLFIKFVFMGVIWPSIKPILLLLYGTLICNI